MPRMRILSASEQNLFDKPPLFDHRDRKKYFEASNSLLDRASGISNPHHRVGFLVSCGYFRATRRFSCPPISRLVTLPLSQDSLAWMSPLHSLIRTEPGKDISNAFSISMVSRRLIGSLKQTSRRKSQRWRGRI